MNQDSVKIKRIINTITTKENNDYYSVCLINQNVDSIEIDAILHADIGNSIFFLHPRKHWSIKKKDAQVYGGYVLSLRKNILDNPLLSKLHINEIRLFAESEIPKINLAPGIEKRVLSILEMLDELVGSHLNHKEDAIVSLLNTFFVYWDGQCNIKSVISENSSKKSLVYNYKKLIDKWYSKYHEVEDYASLLNVSGKYLNECVKETLNTNAKSLINEARLMRARHELKFSDKTIKEIGFELGFSSSDYFSSFFKQHTGSSPSFVRNN